MANILVENDMQALAQIPREFEELYVPTGKAYCKEVRKGGYQLYTHEEMLQETKRPSPTNTQRNKRRKKNKAASKARKR